MTFFSMLERLLIGPLKLVFEIIFDYANQFIGHPGLAIIFLSLAINILVLPLYRRADAMQEETRDREAALHEGVAHIKKVFSGDERMMILQTYYRQNHYRPLDALNGSVSLLLEIPFFIAAYQFLSHLTLLEGVSLFVIRDLSKPDGLLTIGNMTVNVLPVLMTLINVISSSLYLKGFPLKTKIQLYGMSLFFLVFLYTSPSGLVFYWTLNNLFSLVKTIFYKLKHPRKVLDILCAVLGVAALVFGVPTYGSESGRKLIMIIGLGVLLLLPLGLSLLKGTGLSLTKGKGFEPHRKLFLMGTVFLTVLTGLLIPSVFIAASPQEFVDVELFFHPLWYIVSSLCLAAGTFLVWMRVFYWLASKDGKVIFEWIIFALCGVTIVNYMFFGTNLGVISSTLQYEHTMVYAVSEQLINILVLIIVAIVLLVIAIRWKRFAVTALLVSVMALVGMSALNVVTIRNSIDRFVGQVAENKSEEEPHFRLSQSGNNVVVIMLDRAMGEYIPYIFQEKPELRERFSGFTYYENTISFGAHTNFGVPAMIGGYEYTPVEMNKRSSESLIAKHNEALKVMPAIFWENGFEVTVCDPPYTNYQWISDLSIYDDYPGMKSYIVRDHFADGLQKQKSAENNLRNFFCFSALKCMPMFMQSSFYNFGRYHNVQDASQVQQGISLAFGIEAQFDGQYSALVNLPTMTQLTDEAVNTFLFMDNEAAHRPALLQEPDYVPAEIIDNSEYDAQHADRFVVNGRELQVTKETHMAHYHANMAAMLQLGQWFEFLKENDVYDNTRIILVADHGHGLEQMDELILGSDHLDMEFYFPLLMVKDFNAEGFVISDEFMTNADVPTLAVSDLIDHPVNPFTGLEINNHEKYAHDQYVILSDNWSILENSGNTFLPSWWASVKDNIWDQNNWTIYEEEVVLSQHAAP